MKTPEITIGMPVFNDIDFIEESLKSILGQSHKDFKLIISDDGSSDGSGEVCERYANQDDRILYIRQPKNLGISKNMKYLLMQAETPFFMWAGDDDLWDTQFVEKLIALLKANDDACSAFCNYKIIDGKGKPLDEGRLFDYSADSATARLKSFIKNPNDAFGYGIFRTYAIRSVKFPVWWWPNRKCAYNNIYPTLSFYLAKGNITYDKGDPLFFKRKKEEEFVNHKLPFRENSLAEVIAYTMRKFNLVWTSLSMTRKAGGFGTALTIMPVMVKQWYLKPSFFKWKHFIKITLGIKKESTRETDYLY